MIKKYCKDNIHIKITDFELLDVSIYGCDARFEFEIRDNETDVLLNKDLEKVENAFMGVDDSEDIYAFLEEKGIDFSEEYDDDFDELPDELKKKFEAYELQNYNDMYHDWFFESEEEEQEGVIEKIMDEMYMPKGLFYIVKGDSAEWIEARYDYFGVNLSSDTLDIRKVYYEDMEDWIYETEGEFFDVVSDGGMSPDFDIEFFKRIEEHPYTVTANDLENDRYTGYVGKPGDVVYDYEDV